MYPFKSLWKNGAPPKEQQGDDAEEKLTLLQTPISQTSINQTPIDQTPIDQTPIDQTFVNQTPINQTPINQTRVESPAAPKKRRFEYPDTPTKIDRRHSLSGFSRLIPRKKMSEKEDASRSPLESTGPSTPSGKRFAGSPSSGRLSGWPSIKSSTDGDTPKTAMKPSESMQSMSPRTPSDPPKKLSKKPSFKDLMGRNAGPTAQISSDSGTPKPTMKPSESMQSMSPRTPSDPPKKLSKKPSFKDLMGRNAGPTAQISSDSGTPKPTMKPSESMQSMSPRTPSDPPKKLSKKPSFKDLMGRNSGPSTQLFSDSGTPKRVVASTSSTSSTTPSTPSASDRNTFRSTSTSNVRSRPSSEPQTIDMPARLGGLLFDPGAKRSIQERAPIVKRPDSPPVLLSVVPSEDDLDPNAPRPHYYTVPEFLNTIIKYNIQLPNDDPPPTGSKSRVVGVQGSSAESNYSHIQPIMAREKRSTRGKMYDQETTNNPDQHDQASPRRNEPNSTVSDPATPQQTDSAQQEWGCYPPGFRPPIAETNAAHDRREDDTPTWTEEMEAEFQHSMRTMKIGDQIPRTYDWANEDWQTFVQGPEWMTRQRKLKDERLKELREKRQKQNEEREKEAEMLAKKREKNQKKYARKKEKKAALRNPVGWYEGKPTAETFERFLDMPYKAMMTFMSMVLVVYPEELKPYHYVEGKIIKAPDGTRGGLRNKPQMNVLVALNATHHKKVRKALDCARNVLYRENTFAFRNPGEFIMFLNAIGWINIARMNFDKNVVVSSTFFNKHKGDLELKWLLHWHPELRWTMKGLELMTPDWKPEDIDDEYEPPEIENALKMMIEVMDESEQLEIALRTGNSDDDPARIRSLDLGDSFSYIENRIQSMGLADATEAEAQDIDTIKAPDSIETDDGEGINTKDKEKGEETETSSVVSEGRHLEEDWGIWYLDAAAYEPKSDERIAGDEAEDDVSEDSGFYSPSLYSDHGGEAQSAQADDNASATTSENTKLEREVMEMFDVAGPSK